MKDPRMPHAADWPLLSAVEPAERRDAPEPGWEAADAARG